MTDNPYLTEIDLANLTRDDTQFQHLYMAEFYHPMIGMNEDCEYMDRRGEWRPARILDYLMHDRPCYLIEYIDVLGNRRETTTSGTRLRKTS